MTLMPAPKRLIKVYKLQDKAIAEVDINGQPSYFEKMYIHSEGRHLIPRVNYFDLYGIDAQTGKPQYERVMVDGE